jgi:RHH-type proline utilization regulon transcriptional repressor/proline dehydrogenase/delta 1-pyrroline-5-carboxylate dehydrogenase
LPADIYGPARKGAIGIDLSDPKALSRLAAAMEEAGQGEWQAAPVIGGAAAAGRARRVYDPADRRRVIGTVAVASRRLVAAALSGANAAADGWDALGGAARADVLEAAGAEFEADMPALMAVLVREGGKTIADAVAELRETVDFCRYYAMRARTEFAVPDVLPGPTGETNTLALHGRGVFACISPWNFPLAIFTGQVAAALAAGNAVIAKPAEQTTLAAAMATLILHRAGVPGDVLQLLPGNGEVGAALVADEVSRASPSTAP